MNGEKWWADLTAKAKETPGYWLQAIIIDAQQLRHDIWMLLRATLCRKSGVKA